MLWRYFFWEHYHQPLDDFHYRCRWPKFEGLFNDFIVPGVLSAGQHCQAELRLLLFRRLQLQQPLNGSKQFVNRPFSDNHLLPEQFRATGLSLSWSSLFYLDRVSLVFFPSVGLEGQCLAKAGQFLFSKSSLSFALGPAETQFYGFSSSPCCFAWGCGH